MAFASWMNNKAAGVISKSSVLWGSEMSGIVSAKQE
jgi:hypothetical protein